MSGLRLGIVLQVQALLLVSGEALHENTKAVQVRSHGHLQMKEGAADLSQTVNDAVGEASEGILRLVRSDTRALSDESGKSNDESGKSNPHLDDLTADLAGGVAVGACKNFKKEDKQVAHVACPSPLKMVGCSCRDKDGEKNGACGTKFSGSHTCSAYTKLEGTIVAYVRCCHMDWASNFTIVNGPKSNFGEGEGSVARCGENLTLMGCACTPGDAPNNGCMHTTVQDEDSCLATNMKDHPAGVTAQALCADLPNSTDWETRSVQAVSTVAGVNANTNLSCSVPYPALQMLSCSCGSGTGTCSGGKIINHRCECSGNDCNATGRCADIPVPPRDCTWFNWGEWTDCSVSCGNGTRTRIREIAMLSANGGNNCTGPVNNSIVCQGGATAHQCNNTKTETIAVQQSGYTTLIIIVLVVLGITGCGAFAAYQHRQRQHEKMMGEYGEGEWGQGGYGAATGYEGWGGGEQWQGEGAGGGSW